MVQFSNQLEAMHNLKEQLEQRTRLIEANIQRQQDELRQIQDELQKVQGQNLQVRAESCLLLCLLFDLSTVWLLQLESAVCFRCSCRKEPED